MTGGRRAEVEESKSATCRCLPGGSGTQCEERVTRSVPPLFFIDKENRAMEEAGIFYIFFCEKRLALGCAGYLVGLKKDGSGLALECISFFSPILWLLKQNSFIFSK